MATFEWPPEGGSGGGVTSLNALTGALTLVAGAGISVTPLGSNITIAALNSGTVTSVSVVSANGLAGTVANATSTPAITLSTTVTGILQGNGTAISAASTTGSGSVVLATSPTLVTPALGTPSALILTNATGLPLTTGVSGLLPVSNGGTGAATTSQSFAFIGPTSGSGAPSFRALVSGDLPAGTGTVTSVSVVSANGFSGTVATATTTPAITITTTVTGILQGNGTSISAATTTGSGSVVLATSPALVTPALGTPSAAVLTNATGLPLTSGVVGVLPEANGGTNQSTYATGDLLYASAANTLSKLPIGSTNDVLTVAGGLPSWAPSSPTGSTVPTLQQFLLPSYLTITVSAANATAGAVYQDGFGLNFTVLYTIVSGTTLIVSFPANSPVITGTTLTLISGTGDATITLSSYTNTGTYIPRTSPVPSYIRIRMIGGGGGGGGSGSGGQATGGNGTDTLFGSSLLIASGGGGGGAFGASGAAGTATLNSPAIGSIIIGGLGGPGNPNSGSFPYELGGTGTPSVFGGGGIPGCFPTGGIGGDGVANSGAGGGGGGLSGVGAILAYSAGGGGPGGFIDAIISTPAMSYTFVIGAGGSSGGGGVSGFSGGLGASGAIYIEEY